MTGRDRTVESAVSVDEECEAAGSRTHHCYTGRRVVHPFVDRIQ